MIHIEAGMEVNMVRGIHYMGERVATTKVTPVAAPRSTQTDLIDIKNEFFYDIPNENHSTILK